MGCLVKKYNSPEAAERSLVSSSSPSSMSVGSQVSQTLNITVVGVQTDALGVSVQSQTDLSLLETTNDLSVLSNMFADLMSQQDIAVSTDYLLYSAKAMKHLSESGRSNVLYKLAKGIGTIRKDGSDSCLPCKRMPMGMLEYCSDFFSCENIQQVN